MASRVSWNVGDDMGSDQLPITIELECEVNVTKPGAAHRRCKSKGVDWAVFSREVERRAEEFSTSNKLCVRVKTFNEILRSVSRVAVGKTKPRKTNSTPMTPRIKTLVKKRNMLRRNLKTRREEWLEACRETKEAFKERRRGKWIEYFDELVQDQDYSKMWKVVGSLNGRPDSTPANEAMLLNGKTITSNLKKADIFMSHYRGIGRLSFSKEERDKNRLLKTWLRAPTVDLESTANFSMEELIQVMLMELIY